MKIPLDRLNNNHNNILFAISHSIRMQLWRNNALLFITIIISLSLEFPIQFSSQLQPIKIMNWYADGDEGKRSEVIRCKQD